MADDSNIIPFLSKTLEAMEEANAARAEATKTQLADQKEQLGEFGKRITGLHGEMLDIKVNVNGRLTKIERKAAEAEAEQRVLSERQEAQEQRDEKVEKLEREQEREKVSRRRYVVSGVLILLGAAIASLVGSLAPSLIH